MRQNKPAKGREDKIGGNYEKGLKMAKNSQRTPQNHQKNRKNRVKAVKSGWKSAKDI